MKKLLLLSILMITSALSSAQTVSTITGTIKDLTGANVTSGKVTFELRPALDTTMSGIARFTPSIVTCYINGSGLVKAIDLSSPCLLVQNTSLSPNGTWYSARICPQFACSSAFTFYNYSTPLDISTPVPTPTTSPAYSFVDLIANQTIGGNKTFTGSTIFQGSTTFSGTTTITGSVIAAFYASQGLPHVASAGTMRLANGDVINFRNFGDVADINGLSHDSSDRIVVGGANGLLSSRFTSGTANPAASGFARFAASDQACWRNAANLADVCILKDGSDTIQIPSVGFAAIPDGSFLGGNAPRMVALTLQAANATTTFADVPGMSWNVTNGKSYTLDCQILWSSSTTTANPKFQLTGTATATNVTFGLYGGMTASTFADASAFALNNPVAQPGTTVASGNLHAAVVGGFTATSTGTVKVQFAANGAGTDTLQYGSFCKFQ
jgi:hypothetical protein